MEQPAERGLTTAEVAERMARGQVNVVRRRSSRSLTAIIRANVLTLFNGVIVALWVMIMIFGQWQDGLFGLVVVANSAIGIVQELRAKHTLDNLAVVNEAPARVRRDGVDTGIPPGRIVLGDLILLSPGDQLQVDGQVADADGLEVDESLLTGEAAPVVKQPGDQMLSGSFAVAGNGSYVVTRVGGDAYAARLAEEASAFNLSHSELRDGITRFIAYITWMIIPIGALLVWSQINRAGDFGQAVTGAVAGIVTMIPEGLVLMTSIAFAVGVIRLGRRHCLVQELPAIEVLARVDVLCLDKTGTLTAGGMSLDEVRPLRDDLPVHDALGALAHLNPDPDPTVRAIRTAYPKAPGWTPGTKVPFSSARKWSGADFTGQGAWILGAADVLLTPGTPEYVEAEERAAAGLRVLALGRVTSLRDPGDLGSVEAAGIVVLRQQLRPEAAETLRYFTRQGVTIKIISGDNPGSVSAIAHSLGVPGAENAVDARTLPENDPGKLAEILETATVFGRVTPHQKRSFVGALQARGHTVAMTGDGVNDVLALKDADLGVAMGSGSGAARAVAQIVLMDNDFAGLPAVVAEGRRVLANIERVSRLFLTKTFYAIVLSLLTGVIGLVFPFAPRHSTLINALTIGIPAFFLALAPSDERAKPGFVPRVLRLAVPAGVVCAAAVYLSYWAAQTGPSTLEENRTSAVITLFIATWWLLVLIARPYVWWRVALVAAMAALFALALAIPFSRDFFALALGDLSDDLVAVGLGAVAAVALTVVFTIVRSRDKSPGQERSTDTLGS
ncbi:cation-transporting ATPase E [Streptosporangium album]|uniref:Cation-transporting ATPase E n=1 Tax=Streptosporangium album TaxID=47479 RepID=A0A7W7RTQ9_9ACTN|nr:HAD-IC family P-type ATPase [Streptosporangium album]MBB4938049.1 cation-transporting ATPase E [Streptosporangium album]